MKVSMIIACLALVPFILAQAPATEEVDTTYDTVVWDWVNGWFETDPVVTIKDKAQDLLDKVNEAHIQLNEFIVEWEIPAIPGDDQYLSIEEIQAKIEELQADMQQRIQDAMDRLDFDVFNPDPEAESEPQGEPESEPTSFADKFYAWLG